MRFLFGQFCTAGTLNYLQLSLSGIRGKGPLSTPQLVLGNVLRKKKKAGMNYRCEQESEKEQKVSKHESAPIPVTNVDVQLEPGQQHWQ